MDRLIKKVLKGNRKAQSQFYDEFSGLVMGVCHRYARNEDEAADIFQESFVKVFQNLGQIKDISAIHGWVKRITINTALDHMKSIKYFDEITDESHELSDQYYTGLLDKMSNDVILQVIEKLPEGYRIIFNMSIIDGFSHKEIGKQLNISESTSRSQLTHARKLLKKNLNELGITRYEQVI
ncbi:MAG: sigma-70 family RNA polymerase sigma factor [Cyclobacteriaceae bacterium]